MPSKKPAQSVQNGLFGVPISCPDIDNLPLIVEPQGSIEVLAPGSVYQPLLLSPGQDDIDVGPGKLDENEEAFVRDLIRRLYPAGNHPKSDKTPLKWAARKSGSSATSKSATNPSGCGWTTQTGFTQTS